MEAFEEHHPWVSLYLRGGLRVVAFTGVAIVLDRAQMHSYVGRALFLSVLLSTMGVWAQ